MKQYTFTENLVSALIGIILGSILCLFASRSWYKEEKITYQVIREPETVSATVVLPVVVAEEAEPDKYDDLDLLAALVYAEAGNQDMLGKRLVVDVVFNRVYSGAFPDTVEEVIYQRNAFSPVNNGALDKALAQDFWDDLEIAAYEECREAIRLELNDRLDYSIIYFTAEGYSRYGTPAYQHKDHYFSTE